MGGIENNSFLIRYFKNTEVAYASTDKYGCKEKNIKGEKAKWNLYTKSYLRDKLEKGNLPRDLWTGYLNRHGTSELKRLDIPFSFPKPSSLIQKIIKIAQCKPNDLIMDFFAGSGKFDEQA